MVDLKKRTDSSVSGENFVGEELKRSKCLGTEDGVNGSTCIETEDGVNGSTCIEMEDGVNRSTCIEMEDRLNKCRCIGTEDGVKRSKCLGTNDRFKRHKYIGSRKRLKQEEEAALIMMCEKRSMEEKIQDLEDLLNVSAECSGQISEEIRKVIQLWKEILDARTCRNGVIFLAALQENNRESNQLSAYRFFSTYPKALEFLYQEKESYRISKDLREIETYGEIWRIELDTDDPGCDIYYFNHEMKLSQLICCSDRVQKASIQRFEEVYEDCINAKKSKGKEMY